MHLPDRIILSYKGYVWLKKEIDSRPFNGINEVRGAVTCDQKSYIYTHFSPTHYFDPNSDVTEMFEYGDSANMDANMLHFYDKTLTNRVVQSFFFQRLYGRE